MARWMWRWGCWYLAGLSVHVNAAVSVGGSIQSTLASFHRPFLEILTPLNGQVVESSEVDIELVVRDYIMPSSFRTYKVCLGIHENTAISSDGASVGVVEFCFDQTSSKQFHVQNLLPGTSYTVRVVLVDKGTVIAVSMRTFRVAAIAIQGHTENVTILTAMQYALSYQNNLDTDSAMRIYESILAEAPGHGHALHLLGLAKYQRGDTMEAIDYIEQALQTNATHEEFHNSLGLCLKDIGRTAEAATHFETAMSLRPSYIEPRFNLASIWQSTGEYDLAIPVFRAMADKVHSQTLALEYAAQFDVFVRLCDIYLASKQQNMALECLNEALVLWPNDPTFLNERGNLYLNAGYLDLAEADYKIAADAGVLISMLNLAITLDASGDTDESINLYSKILAVSEARGLPTGRVLIMRAGVMPRVLPAEGQLVDLARQAMRRRLDSMLAQDNVTVDSRDPILNAYPTGNYLVSHPYNNKQLKRSLAQMLQMYCPALKTAAFIPPPSPSIATDLGAVSSTHLSDVLPELRRRPRIGFVSEFYQTQPISHCMHDLVERLNRSQFELFVFAVSTPQSAKLPALTDGVEHVIGLPEGVGPSADEIRRHDLDVLVYADVGSDKLSFFLSFANLAPIQAAWGLGHPETTGVPAIDYMVTSEYEHLSFHDHYTETPFPLKGMGIYLKEPLTPHISTYANSSPDDVRATLTQAFHLPSEYRFYFVPEPLVNVHPDMDSIVRRILKRDPIGHVFFLTPPKNSKWKHAFTERIKLQPGLPAHRIHLIIDALDDISTFALLRACDVHLANLYTNKFYHTLEASAAGVPTITLPGELWRSRIPLGLLKHINVLDTVATTPAEYVQLAVRAASDRSFRHQVVGKLQKYAPKLYGDDEAVHEWARFLQFAVDKSRRKRKTHANLRALQDNPTHSTNGLAPPTAKDVTL
ncbi:hypothetical protein, variant [Aphanomyces invadans]|uniref:protein O-GlcNAc transferase n=1 Tax=Aphanomyces invadans TaxID=157072 RepID=A0A024USJ0_9STRA|nr:hypothetical protein, variant [Aphanomyces invadans]ETW09324.1 hypothetical protein, variant [Aphanomyces invadans]|eukprot:XP_008863129.1 hypothetical protein, variant [Aphanomyces invadans]